MTGHDRGYGAGLLMETIEREDVVTDTATRAGFAAFCQVLRLDGSAREMATAGRKPRDVFITTTG